MTPDPGHSVTDDRKVIESNARRTVGIATLRRFRKLLSDRQDEERILRAVVAPVAAVMMIVVAALIWHFGSPRMSDDLMAPLPECSPPRNQNITI